MGNWYVHAVNILLSQLADTYNCMQERMFHVFYKSLWISCSSLSRCSCKQQRPSGLDACCHLQKPELRKIGVTLIWMFSIIYRSSTNPTPVAALFLRVYFRARCQVERVMRVKTQRTDGNHQNSTACNAKYISKVQQTRSDIALREPACPACRSACSISHITVGILQRSATSCPSAFSTLKVK